ncbi:AAA family ATPase, partial [Vibrio parahaemolyticus]
VNISNHIELREIFHPSRFMEDIRLQKDIAVHKRIAHTIDKEHDNIFDKKISNYITSSLESLLEVLNEDNDKKSAIIRSVKRAFFSEFRGEIYPKGKGDIGKTSVKIYDGESKLVQIDLDKEGNMEFELIDDIGFDDATFVDTPSIIQFHQFTDMSRTLFDKSTANRGFYVPLHVKDLSTKLKESIYDYNIFNNFFHVNNNLSDTYKGRLFYDKDSSDFMLDRGTYKIRSSNVASGIKSLGIFDMLVQSGHASDNTILILDEPEVNLHPKWQIVYAKNIVELVRNGANIIVTTHSPYMLEALKGYSEKSDIYHNIYLAKRTADFTSFEDVTRHMEPAIEALSTPLFELNEELGFDDF